MFRFKGPFGGRRQDCNANCGRSSMAACSLAFVDRCLLYIARLAGASLSSPYHTCKHTINRDCPLPRVHPGYLRTPAPLPTHRAITSCRALRHAFLPARILYLRHHALLLRTRHTPLHTHTTTFAGVQAHTARYPPPACAYAICSTAPTYDSRTRFAYCWPGT